MGAEAELVASGLVRTVAEAIVAARRDRALAPEAVAVISPIAGDSLDPANQPGRLYGLADVVDSTVAWLIRSVNMGSGTALLFMRHPVSGRAADDPRIRELRRQLGLPE